MMDRPSWNEYFLSIAAVVATRADCRRAQCGAVIVKDHRIVSTGYNGSPSGGPSCLAGECPRGLKTLRELPGFAQGNHDYSDCVSLHAEQNAIAYASRFDTHGATLYSTTPPCDMCSKLIKAAGITEVITPKDRI
jgi:dCMP deaminase